MGWEPSGVVGFDLGPLVKGQTRIAKLKVLITRLLLVLEVCDGKPTSHLMLAPSFKVQRAYPNLKVLITRLLLVLDVAETPYITLFSSFDICKKDFIIFD